jgi:hypothetical protein
MRIDPLPIEVFRLSGARVTQKLASIWFARPPTSKERTLNSTPPVKFVLRPAEIVDACGAAIHTTPILIFWRCSCEFHVDNF